MDKEEKKSEMKKKPRYVGFWRRFFAFIIDNITRLVLGLIVAGILFVPGMITDIEIVNGIFMGLGAVAFLIIYFGYYPYCDVKYGAPFGKQFLGIVVVDKNLKYLNWEKALLREVLGRDIIDRITSQLLNLLIIVDPEKQAVHDKIAGSYVVYRNSIKK